MDATWPSSAARRPASSTTSICAEVTSIYASLDAYLRQDGHRQRRLRLLRAVVRRRLHLELLRRRADERRRPPRNVDVNDQLSVAGGAHARVYNVQTAPFNPGPVASNVAVAELLAAGRVPQQRPPLRRGRRRLGPLEDGVETPRHRCAAAATGETRATAWAATSPASDVSRPATWRAHGRRRLAVGRQAASRSRARRASTTCLGVGYRFAPRSQAMLRVGARHQPARRAAVPPHALAHLRGDQMRTS